MVSHLNQWPASWTNGQLLSKSGCWPTKAKQAQANMLPSVPKSSPARFEGQCLQPAGRQTALFMMAWHTQSIYLSATQAERETKDQAN